MRTIKKLLIILSLTIGFISCKRSNHCILDCHLESNNIVVVLNSSYKIGRIKGGAVGETEFAEYHTDNFDVSREEEEIKITIRGNESVFENGAFYKIYISWYGGWIETLSKFDNGSFVIEDEDYFNK